MKDEKNLVYLGIYQNEEMYINLKDKNLNGWSLMGLRPETEETLRENQRDTEISELYNVPKELEKYIDADAFSDDMEENWYEHHDPQAVYKKKGEMYYLGFGSGQDIINFFNKHNIEQYETMKELFDELNLTEKQFCDLYDTIQEYKKDKKSGYKMFMKWQKDISQFPKDCEVV